MMIINALKRNVKNKHFHSTDSFTWKKLFVDPQQYVPYFIFVCFARSSAELIGEAIFEEVKKAEIDGMKDNMIDTDNLTSQVGSVGGNHDEGKEPPHTRNHSGGNGSKTFISS